MGENKTTFFKEVAILDYAEWDLSHTDFYSQDGE